MNKNELTDSSPYIPPLLPDCREISLEQFLYTEPRSNGQYILPEQELFRLFAGECEQLLLPFSW